MKLTPDQKRTIQLALLNSTRVARRLADDIETGTDGLQSAIDALRATRAACYELATLFEPGSVVEITSPPTSDD